MRTRHIAVVALMAAAFVALSCAPTPGTVPIAENGWISYDIWQDGVLVDSGAGPAGIDTWFQQSVWQDGDDQVRTMVTYMNTWPPFSGQEGTYRLDQVIRDFGCSFCGSEVEGATVRAPDGTEYTFTDESFEYSISVAEECDPQVYVEEFSGEIEGMPGVEARFAIGGC